MCIRDSILVSPVKLSCRSRGWGKGKRTDSACALDPMELSREGADSTCSIDGLDLSQAMIADGFGAEWRYRRRAPPASRQSALDGQDGRREC